MQDDDAITGETVGEKSNQYQFVQPRRDETHINCYYFLPREILKPFKKRMENNECNKEYRRGLSSATVEKSTMPLLAFYFKTNLFSGQ